MSPVKTLTKHCKPEIFETGNRSHFTSLDFTVVPLNPEASISMDGKGISRGNVIVERLWRSVKYDAESDACVSIGWYLALFNKGCPHSSLDGRAPGEVYFSTDRKR